MLLTSTQGVAKIGRMIIDLDNPNLFLFELQYTSCVKDLWGLNFELKFYCTLTVYSENTIRFQFKTYVRI